MSKGTVQIVVAIIAALGVAAGAYIGGKTKGKDEANKEAERRFQVQVFSKADNSGVSSATVELGGANQNPETTDSAGTAVFVIPSNKLGAQGSLTVSSIGFKRYVSNNVLLQPTRSAHTVYLEPDNPQASNAQPPQPTTAQQPDRLSLTYFTGPQKSGSLKSFSDWYLACSGPPPGQGYRIVSDDFKLSGDRRCNAWSECVLAARTPTQVCWKFRLQGHDEWPPPGQADSEGILSVTWER
jgi:hypothetical protein